MNLKLLEEFPCSSTVLSGELWAKTTGSSASMKSERVRPVLTVFTLRSTITIIYSKHCSAIYDAFLRWRGAVYASQRYESLKDTYYESAVEVAHLICQKMLISFLKQKALTKVPN